MGLINIFEMMKADRYTQDGREKINKALEAEVEDKVYQIGEISQKTGLQKTANGWVKPKSSSNNQWTKTKNEFGKERLTMKTPQGGQVHIYETDNPSQKNGRFKVDTGTHADSFNTLEEAKAFAEKYHGSGAGKSESKPSARS